MIHTHICYHPYSEGWEKKMFLQLFVYSQGRTGWREGLSLLTGIPFPSFPSSLALSLRPPLDRTGVPLPPLSPHTGYVAGSMPLAVTRDHFLAFNFFFFLCELCYLHIYNEKTKQFNWWLLFIVRSVYSLSLIFLNQTIYHARLPSILNSGSMSNGQESICLP